MKNIFSLDGGLYSFFTAMYNILLISFFWFLFSIPIITIGSSTSAAYFICGKWVRNESYNIIKDYLREFKNSFKKATFIWTLLGLFIVIILLNINNNYLFGNYKNLIIILQSIVLINLIIIINCIFMLVGRFEMEVWDYIKSAYFIGIRYWYLTLLSIVFLILLMFISYLFVLPIFIVPSLCILITSLLFKKSLEKYES
ncbi:MAG: YesL family protein [Anaeromicrobium sp.]|jgi:uncharacterized membrane protein YesL|uniref:YesL family protein n=1 Tax=Anaeromicrobium sp. TaxID=1929132 RepID=UPI0025CCEB7D|nr:YesL family protein [Anaeromicrobium sp.]MCT4594459.1 YesL family protein [Anaeromicrobium sp.]